MEDDQAVRRAEQRERRRLEDEGRRSSADTARQLREHAAAREANR